MRFFKKRTNRPSKADLQELKEYYRGLTAAVTDEMAMDLLDSPERCHFLMLLKIADYAEMGSGFSIVHAFKMGYLYAKGKIELGLPGYEAGKAGQRNDGK